MKEEIFWCIEYKKSDPHNHRLINIVIGRAKLVEHVYDKNDWIGRGFRIPDWTEVTAVEINLTEEK